MKDNLDQIFKRYLPSLHPALEWEILEIASVSVSPYHSPFLIDPIYQPRPVSPFQITLTFLVQENLIARVQLFSEQAKPTPAPGATNDSLISCNRRKSREELLNRSSK